MSSITYEAMMSDGISDLKNRVATDALLASKYEAYFVYDLEIQTGAGLFRNLNTRENTGPDIGGFCTLTGNLVGINHSSGCGIGMAECMAVPSFFR